LSSSGSFPPRAVADVHALVKAAVRFAARESRGPRLAAPTGGGGGGNGSLELCGGGSALDPSFGPGGGGGPGWSLTLGHDHDGHDSVGDGSLVGGSLAADAAALSTTSFGLFASVSGLSGGGPGLGGHGGSDLDKSVGASGEPVSVSVQALAALVHGDSATSQPNAEDLAASWSRPGSALDTLETPSGGGGPSGEGRGGGHGGSHYGSPRGGHGGVAARAARAVGEALRRRHLTVPLVFEAHYLDQWHRASTDMFLRVDADGPPAEVPARLAEQLLLEAATRSDQGAEQRRRRTLQLRRRRAAACARLASQRWLATKEPLPPSQVVPEYCDPKDCDEASLRRASTQLLAPDVAPWRRLEQRAAASSRRPSGAAAELGGAEALEALEQALLYGDGGGAAAGDADSGRPSGWGNVRRSFALEALSGSSSRRESAALSGARSTGAESSAELVRPAKPKHALTGYKKRQAAAEEKARQAKFEGKRYPALVREAAAK
jgi:hypothetical protein